MKKNINIRLIDPMIDKALTVLGNKLHGRPK